MNIGQSWTGRLFTTTAYIPVILLAVLMLVPYFWMVLGAFKPVAELNDVPPSLGIQNPTLTNFYDPEGNSPPDHVEGLFQRFKNTPGGFWRYFGNSIFVSGAITAISLLVASLGAFVLSKHRFPGRNILFMIFVGSMMVPWQVTLIAGFLIVRDLGWLDTYTALIVPTIAKAFVLFFLRQYMLSLPDELLDAARVDGASEFRIWWQIILPLVGPALVAMGIFVFLGEWNNLVWPLVIIQSEQLRTLPLALSVMADEFSGAPTMGVIMAASLLVSLPTLILFLVFQRQFVQGIALTGIKG